MTARNLRNSVLTADLAWGVLAMPLAYLLRYGWVWHGTAKTSALIFLPPLMATLLLWSVMSAWVRLDGFRAGWVFSAVLSQLFLGVLALMCALFTLAYLLREYISRLALGYFGLLLFLGFLVIRVIARSILASRRARGLIRRVVIVGNGPLAREMVTKIECHPEMLREVVGFLSPGEDSCPNLPSANRKDAITLQSSNVAELLESRGVDEIILTVPTPEHPEIVDLASRCNDRGIFVSMVPQPYELYLTKHELTDLDGVPLLQLVPVTSANNEPFWKRGFDVCMTLVLLPICLVPMLAAAALLKFKKGRAFCSERRFGKNGVQFAIYRLNSPRTGTGLPRYERLLQRLSITELPQLFNVLRGDMSLVGPRPEGLDRARRYTEWTRQRLKVKPGITGLAQVYGLRHQHSSEDKTRYDLQYVLHRSPFQDISLLLQTAWTLILRMFRKQRPDALSEFGPEGTADLTFQESLVHAHSSQSSAD
jgi:lipopolysaccharide/colanic/teichoic acid biosynthesis glycosyltransferase